MDTRARHISTLKSLGDFISKGDPDRSIVITHHAPSSKSLPDRLKLDPVSCAYASNLDTLITELSPLVWIHGHIHHSQNYRIAKTRVVANPRSYIDDPNPEFNPHFTIDLEKEFEARKNNTPPGTRR